MNRLRRKDLQDIISCIEELRDRVESVRDEGKFMTVTFHPALMNTILRSLAVAGVGAMV